MHDATKRKVIQRLKRISGQVEGIGRMIGNDRYCVDVLLQIASVHAALNQVNKFVIRSHVETCVTEAFANGGSASRKQKIDELIEVFARYCGGRGTS